MNIITKSKHLKSNTHIHRKDFGTVVKKHEKIKPEHDETDYIFRDVLRDCRGKFCHRFEYRCMHDV